MVASFGFNLGAFKPPGLVYPPQLVMTITGHFQGFDPPDGPWSVFMGMWGFAPTDYGTLYTNKATLAPSKFPNDTKIEWSIPNNRNAVSGYLAFSYGKSLGQEGANPITPARLYEISDLTLNLDFVLSGDLTSGGLLEFWTTALPYPTGIYDETKVTDEIGMIFHPTTHDRNFINAGEQYGSFVSGGITWNVAKQLSGNGISPYILAIPSTNADVNHAALYLHDYLAFLLNNARVNSQLYFNGLQIGIEPFNGAGALDTKTISASYVAAARKPWTTSSLVAVALSDTQIRLTAKAIPGATSYKYRKNGGAWTNLPDNSLDWTISGLTASTSYTWEIQGINSVGAGDPSNLVTKATNAPGITEIVLTFDNDDNLSNDWDATTQAVGGVLQYRNTPAYYNRSLSMPDLANYAGKYFQIEKYMSGYVAGGHQMRFEGGAGGSSNGVTHTSNSPSPAPHKERLKVNTGNNAVTLYTGGTAPNTYDIPEIRIRGPYNTSTVDGT